MRQYEQILDKISPTLYKTIQYHDYFYNNTNLSLSYLEHAEVSEVNYLYLPTKNIYYYYIIDKTYSYPLKGWTESNSLITLATKDKMLKYSGVDLYSDVNLISFIITLIINKFSFENEPLMVASHTSNFGLKPLFIALVGEDMYETLRNNIK